MRHLREAGAALADRPMEKPPCERRRHQRVNAPRSRRLTEDGHSFGIASEQVNVALDPFERRDLIEHRIVAGRSMLRLGTQRRVRQKPERPQAIVDRHHDGSALRQRRAVVDRTRAVAPGERATVNPDHHRPALVDRLGRGPHVQVETVLAELVDPPVVERPGLTRHLHARRPVDDGFVEGLPGHHRLRRLEAQLADGRRGVRNAEKGLHRLFGTDVHPADVAAFDLEDRRDPLGTRRKENEERSDENQKGGGPHRLPPEVLDCAAPAPTS